MTPQVSNDFAIHPPGHAVSCLRFTKTSLSAWISLLYPVRLNNSLSSFKIHLDISEAPSLGIRNTFMVFVPSHGNYLYILPCPILWAELCSPPNSHSEALIPSVPIFGDRAFREVMKAK